MSKTLQCNTWKERVEPPAVGGVSVESGDGAPSVLKGMRGQWSND